MSFSEKKSFIYDKLGTFKVKPITDLLGKFSEYEDQEATWPWNIGNAIKEYSNYKVLTDDSWFAKSIDKGLPGIRLRVGGYGFAHYRPVIAYRKPGWWIFHWYEMKVIDLVDCEDFKEGSWETFVPYKHFSNGNVIKK